MRGHKRITTRSGMSIRGASCLLNLVVFNCCDYMFDVITSCIDSRNMCQRIRLHQRHPQPAGAGSSLSCVLFFSLQPCSSCCKGHILQTTGRHVGVCYFVSLLSASAVYGGCFNVVHAKNCSCIILCDRCVTLSQ